MFIIVIISSCLLVLVLLLILLLLLLLVVVVVVVSYMPGSDRLPATPRGPHRRHGGEVPGLAEGGGAHVW